MRKKIKKQIALMSIFTIALTLFSFTPIVKADSITVGNDATERSNIDTYEDFTIIDTNNPASVKSELNSFEYYAKNQNTFRFVIVDTGSVVKWISEEIVPGIVGVNTFIPADAPVVESGWNVGLYFKLSGTIPFNFNDSAEPAFYEKNNAGLPVVGETLIYAGSSKRYYSFVAHGTTLPYGEIISPTENELVFDSLYLEAKYTDGDDVNDDIVQWAVRKGTCAAGVGTVWGNVDSKSDFYKWDGTDFSAEIDISGAEPGSYCFVFNPKDDVGEYDVREKREFNIGHLSVTPEVSYNPVGSEHEVTANIGIGLEGVPLNFAVEGVNSGFGQIDVTDSNGEVNFSYLGINPGMDTIRIWYDLDREGDYDDGEPNVVAVKHWYDRYVSGGGQIIEEVEGLKQKDWNKISFGGGVFEYENQYYGEWEVNFHNVGDGSLDKAKFHGTEVLSMSFSKGDNVTCDDAVNFLIKGEFNNEPGYYLIFRAGDFGSPNTLDTVRFQLIAPGAVPSVSVLDPKNEIYDTYPDEFNPESNCVGTARTGLDNGNITISNP